MDRRAQRILSAGIISVVSLLTARGAHAEPEVEARVGVIRKDFRDYRVAVPQTIGWSALLAYDASIRYRVSYFFLGVTGGYAYNGAEPILGTDTALAGAAVDLFSGGAEAGGHIEVGSWVLRPGLAVGVRKLDVKPAVEGAVTGATRTFFQPRFAFDWRVADLMYIGGLVGVDTPALGFLGQVVVGLRAPEGGASARPDAEEPPFDREAAERALAPEFARCRDASGPFGRGHATVTFEPDGTVSRVVLDEPEGRFAATASGTCVVRLLGFAMVPPFRSSKPVTVGRSFVIDE